VKILQIITRSERRGAEISAAELSEQLARRGHEVRLVSLYAPSSDTCRLLRTEGVGRVELNAKASGRIEPAAMARLWRLIREMGPDVVQANGFHALKYASLLKHSRLTSWPLVYRNISIASRWITRRLQRMWGTWLMRSVDCVLSVSDAGAADICKTYNVPKSRALTIPQGIEIPAVQYRDQARRTLADLIGVDASDPLLFHLGSFTPEKNHEGLLTAFRRVCKRHPRAQLVLCGDGPLRPHIEQRIGTLDLHGRVHTLGNRADARNLLAGGDLLLLSSHIEGIPGVILEAAACGVPAVSTNVGAVAETVEHDTSGKLVPAGDMHALADAVCELLADPERRKQMGAAARDHVIRHHEMNSTIDEFERIYRKLVPKPTFIQSL